MSHLIRIVVIGLLIYFLVRKVKQLFLGNSEKRQVKEPESGSDDSRTIRIDPKTGRPE